MCFESHSAGPIILSFLASSHSMPFHFPHSPRNDLAVPHSSFMGPVVAGQGAPPPMMQERFQSVISQLFQNVRGYMCNVVEGLSACRECL